MRPRSQSSTARDAGRITVRRLWKSMFTSAVANAKRIRRKFPLDYGVSHLFALTYGTRGPRGLRVHFDGRTIVSRVVAFSSATLRIGRDDFAKKTRCNYARTRSVNVVSRPNVRMFLHSLCFWSSFTFTIVSRVVRCAKRVVGKLLLLRNRCRVFVTYGMVRCTCRCRERRHIGFPVTSRLDTDSFQTVPVSDGLAFARSSNTFDQMHRHGMGTMIAAAVFLRPRLPPGK